MFLEILLAILIGVTAGTFTGVIPGLHVNAIAAVSVTFAGLIETTLLVVFIIAMSVTHTFMDILPSTYLGAPGETYLISALPAHQLLMEGKGHFAVFLSLVGGLMTLVWILIFSVVVFSLLPFLQGFIAPIVGYVLLVVVCYLVFKDGLQAFLVFVLAAVLGMLTLNVGLTQPFLPLFSGLFGVSLLLLSLQTVSSIPKQHHQSYSVGFFQSAGMGLLATIGGFFAAFLPGLGTSQIAIYACQFVKQTAQNYLLITGGLNTASFVLSLFTFYIIERARNGSLVAIESIVSFDSQLFFLGIGVALLSCSLASIITLVSSKGFATMMSKIPYAFLVFSVIGFLCALVFFLDGLFGLLFLASATSLGIYTQLQGVAKHHLMGSLLIVVLLFFLS
ncbi:MAG: tripartite tricarboxylate transporter permease [Candidatus Woesearchaeota archaeon]